MAETTMTGTSMAGTTSPPPISDSGPLQLDGATVTELARRGWAAEPPQGGSAAQPRRASSVTVAPSSCSGPLSLIGGGLVVPAIDVPVIVVSAIQGLLQVRNQVVRVLDADR